MSNESSCKPITRILTTLDLLNRMWILVSSRSVERSKRILDKGIKLMSWAIAGMMIISVMGTKRKRNPNIGIKT